MSKGNTGSDGGFDFKFKGKIMKEKAYITTPIYYVNDVPHIGHAYRPSSLIH